MTRSTQSPRVLLEPRHLGALRSILAHNPGASLRKLCPLVASACALPSMSVATLSRFMERHKLARVLPKGMALRARRRADALWQQMLTECGPVLERRAAELGSWQALGHELGAMVAAERGAAA